MSHFRQAVKVEKHDSGLSNPMHDVGSVHDTKAKGKAATLNAMPAATDREDGDNMPAATETVKTSLQTMASASASALRKSLKTNSTEDLQEVGDNMPAATETVKTSLQTMASASGSSSRESLKTQTVNIALQTMPSASADASASREFLKTNSDGGFLRAPPLGLFSCSDEVSDEVLKQLSKENLRRMQMEAGLEAERAAKDRLERERKEKEQPMEDDLAYEREEKAELERERKEKGQQRGDLEEERKGKAQEKEKAVDKEKAEKKETVTKRGLYKRPRVCPNSVPWIIGVGKSVEGGVGSSRLEGGALDHWCGQVYRGRRGQLPARDRLMRKQAGRGASDDRWPRGRPGVLRAPTQIGPESTKAKVAARLAVLRPGGVRQSRQRWLIVARRTWSSNPWHHKLKVQANDGDGGGGRQGSWKTLRNA
ncbi:hypothetical protein L7F22_018893 [Adiantum nelumboides]|nr:hypothetical protein [Adiantum nelumboides]